MKQFQYQQLARSFYPVEELPYILFQEVQIPQKRKRYQQTLFVAIFDSLIFNLFQETQVPLDRVLDVNLLFTEGFTAKFNPIWLVGGRAIWVGSGGKPLWSR